MSNKQEKDGSVSEFSIKPSITMSESAIKQAEKHISKESSLGIAIRVKKNGCSGYGYETKLISQSKEGDIEIPQNEKVSIFISKKDLPFLNKTHIDLKQEGINKVYNFINPNVVAECGCGESFAV